MLFSPLGSVDQVAESSLCMRPNRAAQNLWEKFVQAQLMGTAKQKNCMPLMNDILLLKMCFACKE